MVSYYGREQIGGAHIDTKSGQVEVLLSHTMVGNR